MRTETSAQATPISPEAHDGPPLNASFNWAVDCRGPVRRGSAKRFTSLKATAHIPGFLGRVRSRFASNSGELDDHLKASEWYLDNYTHVLKAVRQVKQDMPKGFLRRLPILSSGPWVGHPRVHVLADGILRESGLLPDSRSVRSLVAEFQAQAPLTTAELWALPAFLRLGALMQLATTLAEIMPEEPYALLTARVGVLPERLDADERVGRCVRSLRTLDLIDWSALVLALSPVERMLEDDPAGVYSLSDFDTRDRCRDTVENIAWEAQLTELAVAGCALALARESASTEDHPSAGNVTAFLIGERTAELESRLGYVPGLHARLGRLLVGQGVRTLLAAIALATLATLSVPIIYLMRLGADPHVMVIAILLALIPASTLGVSVVHWILTSVLKPRVLPKLDFSDAIAPDAAALVVIPCLFGTAREVQSLVRQLELQYLRNSDPTVRFALLSDWTDAASETTPEDEEYLTRASLGVELLNDKHESDGRRPFFLLHRKRLWNPSQGVWMGWERKRGKLEELNGLLQGDDQADIQCVVGELESLVGMRFVITLDAGTVLPTGSAAELVGTLAHPLNQAVFENGRVTTGYTVLQPRVEIAPTATAQSIFTRVFSGDAAIDIYTRAVSDVYQDLCGQGLYVGKGIYEVASFSKSLKGCVPENALVSHDHFEGLHGRAGLVSDIVLYEDYPPQYLAYARRMHRWLRGDWQLLPWLRHTVPGADGGRVRNKLTLLGRWVLFDNLRRSLLAPALLLLLSAAWLWLPGHPAFWATLALLAPAGHVFTALVSSLARGPRRTRTRPWLAGMAQTLRQNLGRWALFVAFLGHEAVVNIDAVVRTLARLFITHKNLLEWRTAEHTAQLLAGRHPHLQVWAEMAASPLIALTLGAAVSITRPESLPWAAPILLLWALAPEVARRISQPRPPRREILDATEVDFVRQLGRRTWLFFDTFVGPEDQWLPPDNYQEDPRGVVAHRTSPTNIGMYLVSTVAAHDFGWIGSTNLLFRMENTLETLSRMEHCRGHILNWYDTRTLDPLLPRYVSAVDSGNLAASLLVAQQACAEAAVAPALKEVQWEGILDTLRLLEQALQSVSEHTEGDQFEAALMECLRAQESIQRESEDVANWAGLLRSLRSDVYHSLDQAIAHGLEDTQATISAPLVKEVRLWVDATHAQTESLRREMDRLAPWLRLLADVPDETGLSEAAQGVAAILHPALGLNDVSTAARLARDYVNGIRDGWRTSGRTPGAAVDAWIVDLMDAIDDGETHSQFLQDELLAFGVTVEELVREMDFGLFYDEESRLLHIGYDVSNARLDANHYDLLASEARIASFLAIAKGDVPLKHWFALGRPVTTYRGELLLISWGGTMFEYLMPSLLMRSSDRTLLSQSCRVAVDAQRSHGSANGVPWGVSESGFYEFDGAMNYQYRAFGVPGLGIRRGLGDDLVIAPYASAMAINERPHEVVRNLERLRGMGAYGAFGLYEAVDFTPGRALSGGEGAIVRSHMAHHQGMVLAALDNYVHRDALVRRFHATSLAQVAELLLHEEVPLGASPELHPEASISPPVVSRTGPSPSPWWPAVGGETPEVQVVSNGHLATGITDSGGGWTSWRGQALTRWEADGSCERHGTWVYVRDAKSGHLWSAGVSPTGVRGVEEHVIFHAHMVEIHRREDGIFLRCEVVVAQSMDVELRSITVTNETSIPRSLSITTCMEPVLALARDDSRHPAFSKLFIESERLSDIDGLLFRRRPRSSGERPPTLVQALVLGDGARFAGFDTDRGEVLGRGHTWARPAAVTGEAELGGATGYVLDPVSTLSAELQLPPGATERVVLVTSVAQNAAAAIQAASRVRTLRQVDWIIEDAQAAVARELRERRIPPKLLPAIQRLTSFALFPAPYLRADAAEFSRNEMGRPGLWGRGISGDHPIVLVEVGDTHGVRLVSEVLLAHHWWQHTGVSIDLVILLTGGSSYTGEDEDRIGRLIAQTGPKGQETSRDGVFVAHADQMTVGERRILRVAAGIILDPSLGRLADQFGKRNGSRWRGPDIPPPFVPVFSVDETWEPTPVLDLEPSLELANPWGGFSPDGKEYVIQLDEGISTPAPWCNVLANPQFGCLVSENGLGMTWSQNASERRLTPWRNDAVTGEPSEVLYVRDEETGAFWSPTSRLAGDHQPVRVRHGAGWTNFSGNQVGVEQSTRVFVPRAAPVKIVSITLKNVWKRRRRLTLTYYAELVLGAARAESGHMFVHEFDQKRRVLLTRNPWQSEHAERTVLLACDREVHGLTTDRREFLGARGTIERPAALGRWGLSGGLEPGRDACQALMTHIELEPGSDVTVHFIFGEAESHTRALELVERFSNHTARADAWAELSDYWDGVLGAIQVNTPDPAMNIALNRWFLYQSIASRIEGRTGMYQSSGAFGFRDQLQDVMALVHAEPMRTRAQIIEAAGHQFPEGDVLHWWHPPGARGVRTRCSDDLLWLPFVACHYARATGDWAIFEERVTFLHGDPLAEGEHERYAEFSTSSEDATLIEHCQRALIRSLPRGEHGLPLIGSCDWNDGFSKVGSDGRGESVWLAWFSMAVMNAFAELMDERGDAPEAKRWRREADSLSVSLEASAWDGEWYLRAWFDDGTPLGSHTCQEGRIDLIAQAWSSLSRMADPDRVKTALQSAERWLVDGDNDLVRLLSPPFHNGSQDPGYIMAYPPGVRENGGQYTHAGTWLGLAHTIEGDGKAAHRTFRKLNPLERAADAATLARYRVEPYVVAGDVYHGAEYGGRGGWTWYTGAAPWLWRLGVEGILGLTRERGALRINPCIPPEWDGFEAVVKEASVSLHIMVKNPEHVARGVVSVTLNSKPLDTALVPIATLEGVNEVWVTLGPVSDAAPKAPSHD